MRWWEVFKYEVRYRTEQPLTWFYVLLLLLLCALRAEATDVGIVRYHASGMVAFSAVIVGILSTFITAALFVEAGQRDFRWGTSSLFFTTPIRRIDYLGGRFIGAFTINALLLLAVPPGLIAGGMLLELPPELAGTLHASSYAVAYLIFLLPNLLVNAAVLFGLAISSRRGIAPYLGALALVTIYLFSGVGGAFGQGTLAALLDPTGAAALGSQVAAWTAAEQNTKQIALIGLLLWNRLIWVAVAGAVLLFAIARFRIGHALPRRRPGAEERQDLPDRQLVARGIDRPVLTAPRSFALPARLRQMLHVAGFELRRIAASREFIVVEVGLLVFALLDVMEGLLTSAPDLWPFTADVLAGLTGSTFQIMIGLLLIFFAGELVWSERETGIEKVTDAAPDADWSRLLGKSAALAILVVFFLATLAVAGLLGQILQGYANVDVALYVRILFGMQLADHLLFAVLALSVHVLVNHKYVGHLVSALILVGLNNAGALGIQHNLLLYGSDAGWTYSALNEFGPFLEPFIWFKLYWAAWAAVLLLVVRLFWIRGVSEEMKARIAAARHRFTPRVASAMAGAFLLVLATGGFVFYNTNVLSHYQSSFQANALPAEYERRYKKFENIAQPTLQRVQLDAHIHPESKRAEVRGRYWLVNASGESIDSIHLSLSPPEFDLRLRFAAPGRVVLDDRTHRYHIFDLERPLAPGDSIQLQFEIEFERRGFQNSESASSGSILLGQFTHVPGGALPAVGYQREDELSSNAARREHGLPPATGQRSITDDRARNTPRIGRMQFEGTVSTSADQVGVLPGTLTRTWQQGHRRYFHYRADAPILNFFSILSGGYAVAESRANGVAIRVLHHPEHAYNVPRIMSSAGAALAYFAEQFGPYPHRQLTLTEFPRYSNFLRAHGAHIIYSENSVLARSRVSDNAPFDQVAAGVGHEVSHLWWGQQVMGADVEGSHVLSESLAQYSALMLLEHMGKSTNPMLLSLHQQYLYNRGDNPSGEVPLLLSTDQTYLLYGKGALVLHTLQDYVGRSQVNSALQRLVTQYGMKSAPYPTTLDLYRELRDVTPDSLRYLLQDMLSTITFWDLRATSASARQIAAGYRVDLQVHATKVRADRAGNLSEVPMNDLVDIAVFPPAEAGDPLGAPIYLRKHRVRSGTQTISVAVPTLPGAAGIDPYHKLIARHVTALESQESKVQNVMVSK